MKVPHFIGVFPVPKQSRDKFGFVGIILNEKLMAEIHTANFYIWDTLSKEETLSFSHTVLIHLMTALDKKG